LAPKRVDKDTAVPAKSTCFYNINKRQSIQSI